MPPARRRPDDRAPPAARPASGPASPRQDPRGSRTASGTRRLARGPRCRARRPRPRTRDRGPIQRGSRSTSGAPATSPERLGPPDVVDRRSDVWPAEEREPSDTERDPGPGQGRLDRLELGVRPGQDGDLRRRGAGGDQRPHPTGEPAGLGVVTRMPDDLRDRSARSRRRERLRPAGAPQEPVRELEDLGRRAVVLGQVDDAGAGVAVGE